MNEKSSLKLDETTENMLEVGPLILGLDRQGKIIFFNDKCEEVTEYSEEEVVGSPVWEFFPENYELEEAREYLLSTERDSLPKYKVIPWISKEGENRPVKWKTIHLKGASGDLESVIAVGLDLREFERAYGDLGKTASVFESIVNNMDSGIFVTYRTDDGLLIQANNSRLENIFGYDSGELKEEKLDRILSSADLKKMRDHVEDIIENGEKRNFKIRGEKKDGKEIWLESRLIPVRIEDRPAVLGMVNESAKPEGIIDHAKIGIVIVQDGEIKYFNKRIGDIFECPEEEFEEEGILNFVHPEDKDGLDALDLQKVEERSPFTKEFRIITNLGKVRYVSSESVQVTYNGEPATQLVIEDITEYKEMEKRLRDRREELSEAYTRLRETQNKLRDRNEQLERTSETRAEFIDMIAHEFSSLLTPAKTYVDILSAEEVGDLNENQKDKLSQVKGKFAEIEGLVQDMLDLSRIEADRIKAGDKSVSIEDILNGVIADLRDKIDSKDHELAVEISEDLPDIVGGPRLLEKVFKNLISNAIQYTPRGGNIEVGAEVTEDGIRVSVSDNGVGIPEEERENIFQKFYRGREESGEESRGLGIGLAITKHFVELHDGKIWVESEEGEGSTFYVLLPT